MKFLVAIDGSKNAVKATKYAAKLLSAISGDNSITLISVHDNTGLMHASRFVGKDVVQDYLRELADKDLAEARKVLERAGVKHDMIIRTGRVAQEIVDAAAKGKFDMIVMGSKGRSALKDIMIGSVAQRVSGLSKVTVLLVP